VSEKHGIISIRGMDESSPEDRGREKRQVDLIMRDLCRTLRQA
jgi:hypothetical protein